MSTLQTEQCLRAYPSPRSHVLLAQPERRVELAMRRNGIRARGKRRFRVCTTDSNHALPIAPNLLARNFAVAAPNTVWAGDMIYIPTREGWLYLSVVLDLFSRRIVGWSMGETIDSELACRALDITWRQRLPSKGLILRSFTAIAAASMPAVATRTFSREMESGRP